MTPQICTIALLAGGGFVTHSYMQLLILELVTWTNRAEEAFTHTGFSNWNDPGRVMDGHVSSSMHKEAVMKVTALNTQEPINAILDTHLKEDQLSRNAQLVVVIRALKYLSHQNVALQGLTVQKVKNEVCKFACI